MSQKNSSLKDLQNIYDKALKSGQLAVALKAKELILKLEKAVSLCPYKHLPNKPLSQWSDQEIEELLTFIEENAS